MTWTRTVSTLYFTLKLVQTIDNIVHVGYYIIHFQTEGRRLAFAVHMRSSSDSIERASSRPKVSFFDQAYLQVPGQELGGRGAIALLAPPPGYAAYADSHSYLYHSTLLNSFFAKK